MLSTAAFNALLKTLEEPPPQVVFVLATTDPQRVLPTILSRCQRFDFRRIPLEALEKHLTWIAAQEAIGITAEALQVVAQRAQGGLRDAESLLDQLSLLPPPIEPLAVWELLGAVPEQELLLLARAMAEAEPLGVIEACRQLLERGREPGAVLQGLASLLRDLLLAGVAPDRLELTSVSPAMRPELPAVARSIGKARLLHWQAQLKGSEQQLRHSMQPRLWLEVLLLGLLAEPQARPEPKRPVEDAPAQARSGAEASAPVRTTAPAAGARAAEATAPALITAHAPGPTTSGPPEPASSTAPGNQPEPGVPSRHGQPETPAPGTAPGTPASSPNLGELWQQILAGLELPSTRMLLSQQAHLHRLDNSRALVRVSSNWIAMVQSRLPLLEGALTKALGSPRQVTLEASDQKDAAPIAAPLPVTPPVEAMVSMAAARPASRIEAPPLVPKSEAPASSATAAWPQPEAASRGPSDAAPRPPTPNDSQRAMGISSSGRLDEKAKLFADFFNGEVVAGDDQPG
jgi:DNA polymerase-3 subunit gamma/tau